MQLPRDVETKPDWHLESPYIANSSHRTFYVHQGEIAYGVPESQYDCVGSDDATTCFIMLCRHAASGQLLATHLDSAQKCELIYCYIDSMVPPQSTDRNVDVYISGGMIYMSDSINTLHGIFTSIKACQIAVCRLKLLNFSNNCGASGLDMVGKNLKNTKIQSYMPKPHVKGCGFLINKSSKYNSVEVVPMHFPLDARGPLSHLRQATSLFLAAGKLRVVYSTNTEHFLVDSTPSAEMWNLDQKTIEYFCSSLNLPDDSFLQEWSTSPHCEPLHFTQELKSVLKLLIVVNRQGKEAIPSGGQFRFGDGKWIEVTTM